MKRFFTKTKLKMLTLFALVIGCFSLFISNTYAYTYDSQTGNLYSNNLFNTNLVPNSSYYNFNNGSVNIISHYSNSVHWDYDSNFINLSDFGLSYGQYNISTYSNNNVNLRLYLTFYDSNNEQLYQTQVDINSNVSFSIDYNYTKLVIKFLTINTNNVDNSLINVMLSKGSSPLDFEPYGVVWYSNPQAPELYLKDVTTNVYISDNYKNYISSDFYNYGFDLSDNLIFDVEFQHIFDDVDLPDNTPLYLSLKFGTPINVVYGGSIYYKFVSENGNNFTFNYLFTDGSIFIDSAMSGSSNDYSYTTYFAEEYSGKQLKELNIWVESKEDIVRFIKFNASFVNGDYFYNQGYQNAESYFRTLFNNEYNSLKKQYDNLKALYDNLLEHANPFQSLVFAIVESPLKFFNLIWDFDILGFNIAKFILGALTVLLIIWIIKKIL